MRRALLPVCLLVGLLLTGCTTAPATPTPRSLLDPAAYGPALRAIVRHGMVAKIKEVRVTDRELVVVDESDQRLTYRDGQVTGPEKSTNPVLSVAEDPARFEIRDPRTLWRTIADRAGQKPSYVELTLAHYTVWSTIRALVPRVGVAELDGREYQPYVPKDEAGFARDLERVGAVAPAPRGIEWSGDYVSVFNLTGTQMQLLLIAPDGTVTTVRDATSASTGGGNALPKEFPVADVSAAKLAELLGRTIPGTERDSWRTVSVTDDGRGIRFTFIGGGKQHQCYPAQMSCTQRSI